MEYSEYAKLAAFEEKYWWHVGRRGIVSRQLATMNRDRRRLEILNVGGGTGGTVEILAQHGTVLNIDHSQEAVDRLRNSGYAAFRMDGKSTSFGEEQFDLLTGLDVLEHIEDDSEALAEWHRVLKPGGYLLLTVPAYQWLWSGHDLRLGHFRRYTACQLRHRVEQAGFQVQRCTYAIVFSFPLIAAFRLYQKLFRPHVQASSYVELPHVLNELFISLLRMEGFLLQRCKFPFGTSVLLIAQKVSVTKRELPPQWLPDKTSISQSDEELISAGR